jgi:ribose transport system ATP-binding protein
MTENNSILSLSNLSKAFGGNRVLNQVALSVKPGEVHALLGQNGSGKSTIIKILAGFHDPDPGGSLVMRGRDVRLPVKPGEARTLGIEFVHQNLGLVEQMGVVDNLFVGRYETGFGGRIKWRSQVAASEALLQSVGATIRDVHAPVMEIGQQADRALLAIGRAEEAIGRYQGTGILILDEPTVYLPKEDIDRLKKQVRSIAARGNGVIYVTHRLDELPGFADTITVLRDGVVVGNQRMSDVSLADVVSMIIGKELGQLYPKGAHESSGEEVVGADNLCGRRVDGVSFSLHGGEILGVTGLVGMGYENLPYIIWGATPIKSGTIRLAGKEVKRPTPSGCLEKGISFIPSDRARQGAVLTAPISENLTLNVLGSRFFKGGFLRKKAELAHASDLIDSFGVQPRDPNMLMGRLSGGNQQKALLAKWMQTDPKIVMMDEPTQGIDIGSRKEIFARIARIRDQGSAVLIASAEYEDLANICHRVLVMRHGKVVAELAGDALTKENIVHHCYLA